MTTTGYSTGTSGFTGANATINLDYGAAVRELAVTNGTLFADVYAYMAANGGDSLIGGDNIHPNDTGHAAIAASVLTATTVS
jgi:lysophospholipase L1-like esterase